MKPNVGWSLRMVFRTSLGKRRLLSPFAKAFIPPFLFFLRNSCCLFKKTVEFRILQTDYRELLSRAYSELPPKALEHKRFEIPKAIVSPIGMRTIFHNFKDLCVALNRDPHHVLKFLSKEMATSATVDENRAIFQGKFFQNTIDRLIKRYTDEFVTCPICKRPDTKIVKEKRLYFLVCEACGARSSIRTVWVFSIGSLH